MVSHIKEPHRAIDKIVLVEPQVDFKEQEKEQPAETSLLDSSDINILEVLYQFENIDRIHLKNGRVSLLRKDGEKVSLTKNLNGWIDSRNFTGKFVQPIRPMRFHFSIFQF